jgi:hypothetical protein
LSIKNISSKKVKEMDDAINYKRRRFMTNFVIGLAGAELYAITSFGGPCSESSGPEFLIGQSASSAGLYFDSSAYAKKFSGKYEHRLINGGIGHNLP